MTIEEIIELMLDIEDDQLVCIEDENETTYFLGTVAELRDRGAIHIPVLKMYTERYTSYGGQSGLTIVIE